MLGNSIAEIILLSSASVQPDVLDSYNWCTVPECKFINFIFSFSNILFFLTNQVLFRDKVDLVQQKRLSSHNPSFIHSWSIKLLFYAKIQNSKCTANEKLWVCFLALPMPFGHLITVPSTVDKLYFQLYFWKKNHIIQTVVRTLKPV